MDPFLISQAVLAAGAADADPNQTIAVVRALIIGLVGLGFLVVGLTALFGPARKGNTRRSWDHSSASLVALIPIVLGAGGMAIAFGVGVLNWAVPWINA